MTKKQRAKCAVERLQAVYPDAVCSLDYTDPFRLLVAVRLSAQCTDARVNQVTPALFARFPDMAAFAAASPEEVEPYIHSCGFFRGKARDLVAASRVLLAEYDGKIDAAASDYQELARLMEEKTAEQTRYAEMMERWESLSMELEGEQ